MATNSLESERQPPKMPSDKEGDLCAERTAFSHIKESMWALADTEEQWWEKVFIHEPCSLGQSQWLSHPARPRAVDFHITVRVSGGRLPSPGEVGYPDPTLIS